MSQASPDTQVDVHTTGYINVTAAPTRAPQMRLMRTVKTIITDKALYANGLPMHATAGSAAVDLLASQDAVLLPGQQVMMDTGLRIFIEDLNYAAIILPRSGAGTKGLILGNSAGLIDADYQGPLKCCLLNRNTDDRNIIIARGERIAQLLLIPVIGINFQEVESFEESERGSGGFGSTGS